MTNIEKVLQLIREHPEGLDDDEIAELSGVRPRQQVHQICQRLQAAGEIRRESVVKPGKRRKMHNFPATITEKTVRQVNEEWNKANEEWKKRLAALVAATGKGESELLNEALQALALKVLEQQRK